MAKRRKYFVLYFYEKKNHLLEKKCINEKIHLLEKLFKNVGNALQEGRNN